MREGISPNGYYYSKEVLQNAVDDFNEKCKGEGILGSISVQYNPPFNLDEKSYISHSTTSLSFDGEKVEARINFLNNEYGRHLISLLSNVPEHIKVTPIIAGSIDDGNVSSINVTRIDFVYDKLRNNT